MTPLTSDADRHDEQANRQARQDAQLCRVIDQIALVTISSLLIAAIFAALETPMKTILIILVIVLVAAVGLGFIEAGQKRRK